MRGWRSQDFLTVWEQRDITRDQDRLTGMDPMTDLYPDFGAFDDDDNWRGHHAASGQERES